MNNSSCIKVGQKKLNQLNEDKLLIDTNPNLMNCFYSADPHIRYYYEVEIHRFEDLHTELTSNDLLIFVSK